MVAVSVLVPVERLGEFYVLLGRFHEQVSSPARIAAPRRRVGVDSKYAPLRDFLAAASGDAVRLSFSRVEELLGAPLPVSARRHRSYWANSRWMVPARSWLDAGWRVESVDLLEGWVSFVRAGDGQAGRSAVSAPVKGVASTRPSASSR